MRSFNSASPASTYAPPAGLAPSAELGPFGVLMSFAKDEEIYAQEEEADLVYRVVSGAVRITCLMADGRRHVAGFHFPGEFFGLESGEHHAFSAEALCDTVVAVAKRRLVERDGEIERLLWTSTARELSRIHAHMLLLSRKTASERVATFLLEMAERQGAKDSLFLPMGRQDIADYLGLTIETVSRMMTRLQADRLIEMDDPRHVRIRQGAALMECCE
jgi:CRP/FNR family nitrogen fixation transcriptional regulator